MNFGSYYDGKDISFNGYTNLYIGLFFLNITDCFLQRSQIVYIC